MNRIKILIYILSIFVFAGCVDDGLGFSNADFRDGTTTLDLELEFSPFSAGNLTRAKIEDGNGKMLNTVEDLCLLVYDADGNLLDNPDAGPFPMEVDLTKCKISDEDRVDADASNGETAESATKRVTGVRLSLPFGSYYIVGVANLKGGTKAALMKDDAYKTLDGLRRIRVEWSTDLTKNGEMMGYFTDAAMEGDVPTAERIFQRVAVNRPGMKLHTWLRRCASKVTIDFDGSNLRDKVKVYIKEARIYDIAYDCTLGFGKSGNENVADYNNSVAVNDSISGGYWHATSSPQVISYVRGKGAAATRADAGASEVQPVIKPNTTGWPCISNGMPLVKDNESEDDYDKGKVINFHAETADALYFYENMQDNPDGKTKLPHADLNGGGVVSEEKDGIPYGTYIEVTGYYESNADGNLAHGDIKYRFMLGKNVTDDFHAERNYHYKLTVMPRGNGNDCDWHIDFDEASGFHTPNPWYVSYLYNHDAMLPFKYTPDPGWEVCGLEAEIITNPWYPTEVKKEELKDLEYKKYPSSDPGAPKDLVWDITPTHPDGDEDAPYEDAAYDVNKNNGNGFLSLRVTNKTVITDLDAGLPWGNGGSYSGAASEKYNENYYLGKVDYTATDGMRYVTKIDRSKRVYLETDASGAVLKKVYDDYPADTPQEVKDRDDFTYQSIGDAMSFNIPLFTRAKVMVKQTGYSGNNPFVGYERIGRVKLTVTLREKSNPENKKKRHDYVNVIQVRRIVNPKGVYRRADNNEPFRVTMMWLDGDGDNENAKIFNPVTSHGPWKAEIIGDKNFITLDGQHSVSGKSDTKIDFTIRFNKANGAAVTPRNAVVRVKYHNYTCTHLIFVRQGYDAQPLYPSGKDYDHKSGGAPEVKWSLFNMITKTAPAHDPRDEGSLFKFGNADDPIDVINNVHKGADGKNIYNDLVPEQWDLPVNKPTAENPALLHIAKDDGSYTTETKKWSEIDPTTEPSIDDIGKPNFRSFKNAGMDKVATMRHFEQLYLTEHVEFGYGVLYADGATSTAGDIETAYGYCRHDAKPNGDSPRGMRGMFAYYWDGKVSGGNEEYNGRNLFFPIGRSGYGHRKNYKEGADGKSDGFGILRYSCNRGAPNTGLFGKVGPIFASIYRRPGAIYWARETAKPIWEWNGALPTDNYRGAFGLDINYFSFDVNSILDSNIRNGADACFVRCVEE